MRKIFQTYPNLSRLILSVFLLGLALILSGLIPNVPFLSHYFNLGTILVIFVTWVMYRTENKSLNALGFNLDKRNILFLPIGLFLGVAAFVAGFYLRTFVTGEHWNVNHDIIYSNILSQLYWVLSAAAVQEFIVRGYCFKKIIEMSNQTTAIIICGLVFIAMHNVWNGDIMQSFAYALVLFIGHLMFCEALLKSGTIYFAIGLHWGNNLASSNLFTIGRTDTSILFTTTPHPSNLNGTQFWLLFLLANIGFITLTFLIWKWTFKKNVITI